MSRSETEMEQIISDFAKSIQNTIAEGEWDALNDVLQERQNALEKFFSNLEKGEKSLVVKEMIKKIQQEDAVFLSLVQAQEKEMKEQFTSLKKGRKSVKAYQQL